MIEVIDKGRTILIPESHGYYKADIEGHFDYFWGAVIVEGQVIKADQWRFDLKDWGKIDCPFLPEPLGTYTKYVEQLKPKPNEMGIDAGAYDGISTLGRVA